MDYETIRRELRKMNSGKRKLRIIYGKYKVELVKNNLKNMSLKSFAD